VGRDVGRIVGCGVGCCVGFTEGVLVGVRVGLIVGVFVGLGVGEGDGTCVGKGVDTVGLLEGALSASESLMCLSGIVRWFSFDISFIVACCNGAEASNPVGSGVSSNTHAVMLLQYHEVPQAAMPTVPSSKSLSLAWASATSS